MKQKGKNAASSMYASDMPYRKAISEFVDVPDNQWVVK